MKHLKTLVAGIALVAGMSTAAQAASTLESVKAAGKVKCGVNTGLAGFGRRTIKGVWAGLDIDLCKGSRGRRVSATPTRSNTSR